MYFILSTFTTTAYGDILAVDYFEKLLTAFVAFSSLIWFGLVLSDMLSGLQNTVDTSYHLAADVVLVKISELIIIIVIVFITLIQLSVLTVVFFIELNSNRYSLTSTKTFCTRFLKLKFLIPAS